MKHRVHTCRKKGSFIFSSENRCRILECPSVAVSASRSVSGVLLFQTGIHGITLFDVPNKSVLPEKNEVTGPTNSQLPTKTTNDFNEQRISLNLKDPKIKFHHALRFEMDGTSQKIQIRLKILWFFYYGSSIFEKRTKSGHKLFQALLFLSVLCRLKETFIFLF